ncbi:DUF4030 domain-containing protein [Priestia megaterium]|jgi:hypothetical protein|uniref:DUF4030 domain-containing protein n=1 Tax=Priestia megaterium TaxID=1404 RepID=UPI00041A0021|nr:DUF4030 domain-containing protein [Priestia megaterium]RFB33267.1 DUF4030 domain-containing protein [Bacillus sp. RC]MBW0933691.1 DUF4030 domain-containing protein [Priestia megaterium]MCR8866756.1 DUF4030 domain-containing protein [Priestia megaterium]PFK69159.1 DUF4030 domain-containing protein [Priestia megaterium]PGK60210.1 DUF4030 domain-containing protein [Priestia megaterium]
MKLIRNILFLSCVALLLAACQNADTTSNTKDKDLDTILSDISDKYAVLSVGSDSKDVKVEVEDTEDVNKVKADIKRQLKENGLNAYKVNVRERNVKQVEKENRWLDIESKALAHLQENKEYKDVTYKKTDVTLKQPVTVAIVTPIVKSDDGAQEYSEKIKKEVNTFLQTKDIKKQSKGDSYKIVIYDQDDQVIS